MKLICNIQLPSSKIYSKYILIVKNVNLDGPAELRWIRQSRRLKLDIFGATHPYDYNIEIQAPNSILYSCRILILC